MTIRTITILSALLSASLSIAAEGTYLKEDYQVIQRDQNDQGSCIATVASEAASFNFTIRHGDRPVRSGGIAARTKPDGSREVVLEKLPVGGPYEITISPAGGKGKALLFRNILVGDIWILGGQSNMFGIDVIKEDLPALPYLNMLNPLHIRRDAHWCAGVPPIHRIPEEFAPFVLKGQNPAMTQEQISKIIAAKTPVGGIDCSYFFARKLYAESGVPIGLIPCAIGGSLAIWSPQEREQNRYGFMHHHVLSAGGRIKGLLFFQGEQDAIFGDEKETVTKPSLIHPTLTYGSRFKEFVEALRKDCRNPTMPVIFAQICRHHNGKKERDKSWELIRETQRRIPESLTFAHCVPAVDLNVMDGLHLDYASLKRVGERMAYVALPYVKKGVPQRSEIKLQSVGFGKTLKPTIVVEFSGVNGKLRAAGRATGFHLKKKDTGEVVDWIYKIDFDPSRPNVLILHTTLEQNQGLLLYYGAGAAPYVNITDEIDMAVPAFGPIEVK